jgi:hypothetical protein
MNHTRALLVPPASPPEAEAHHAQANVTNGWTDSTGNAQDTVCVGAYMAYDRKGNLQSTVPLLGGISQRCFTNQSFNDADQVCQEEGYPGAVIWGVGAEALGLVRIRPPLV